jgi:hypothetical protein
VLAFRIVEAELREASECHANSENLSGAEVAMRDFGFFEELVEGLHRTSLVH